MSEELRIRGGVACEAGRWRPIVHLWWDGVGLGAPDEDYCWRETYATEAAALEAYRRQVRPALEAMLEAIRRTPGARAEINRWGFGPRQP